jgi:hypothetical protein
VEEVAAAVVLAIRIELVAIALSPKLDQRVVWRKGTDEARKMPSR